MESLLAGAKAFPEKLLGGGMRGREVAAFQQAVNMRTFGHETGVTPIT